MHKDYIHTIKQKYPSLREKDVKVYNDRWDYIVYVIADKEAFRFPRRDDYAKTLPREVAFLDVFSPRSPVQVPKLTLSHLPDSKPYVTYTFIPGVQFTDVVSETFSQQELNQVAHELGSFLTALHSFPKDKAKEMGIGELQVYQSWSERLDKIKTTVFPHISFPEQQWITQLFTNFLDGVKNNPPQNCVTHADMMPEHIIVDPDVHRLNGIIDFGDMVITDPAYDFTYFRRFGQDFLHAVYQNYKIERDITFDKRRQFYEERLLATNLEHSLNVQHKKRIELHKEQLTAHVSGNKYTSR